MKILLKNGEYLENISLIFGFERRIYMEKIINELKKNGYDYAIAVATKAEIKAGAACGQLSIIIESEK